MAIGNVSLMLNKLSIYLSIYGEYFPINIKASLIEIVSYVLYLSILNLTITVSLINT